VEFAGIHVLGGVAALFVRGYSMNSSLESGHVLHRELEV